MKMIFRYLGIAVLALAILVLSFFNVQVVVGILIAILIFWVQEAIKANAQENEFRRTVLTTIETDLRMILDALFKSEVFIQRAESEFSPIWISKYDLVEKLCENSSAVQQDCFAALLNYFLRRQTLVEVIEDYNVTGMKSYEVGKQVRGYAIARLMDAQKQAIGLAASGLNVLELLEKVYSSELTIDVNSEKERLMATSNVAEIAGPK